MFGGGRRRSRSSSTERGVEMTTFSQTQITRARSGSFTGRIDDSPQGKRTGYAEFKFSATTGVFDVKTIASDSKGGGSRMMAKMEHLAREHGATSMETATSRPGFFKKVGFDYTPQQKAFNARKYTAEQLEAQESNRGEGGGGFMMSKDLT